jgi:hypothetical protein
MAGVNFSLTAKIGPASDLDFLEGEILFSKIPTTPLHSKVMFFGGPADEQVHRIAHGLDVVQVQEPQKFDLAKKTVSLSKAHTYYLVPVCRQQQCWRVGVPTPVIAPEDLGPILARVIDKGLPPYSSW